MRRIVMSALVVAAMGGTYVMVARWKPVSPRPAAKPVDELSQIFAAGIVEGTEAPLELRFEVPGRVQAIHVREGQRVRAGQILAELEPTAADLRVSQAVAQRQIAAAELDRLGQGRGTSGSYRDGGREGTTRLVSGIQASREDLSIAEARVDAADAALKLEQLMRSKTRCVAPTDGQIVDVPLREGELAGATSAGITIVNRETTRVRAFVEELDALNVAVGQQAVVLVSGRRDRKFSGTVSACALEVRPKSHQHLNPGERLDVRVREIMVDLDDGSDLLLGLPVEVFIAREPSSSSGRKATARSSAR